MNDLFSLIEASSFFLVLTPWTKEWQHNNNNNKYPLKRDRNRLQIELL